jgi:hypothetical protein
MSLIKEAFQIYRQLSLESQVPLCSNTWQVLLTTLLDIIQHMLCRPNKYAGVSSPPLAEEFCDIAIESVLTIWVRSGTRSESNWQQLREVLIKCTGWKPVAVQWAVSLIISLSFVV